MFYNTNIRLIFILHNYFFNYTLFREIRKTLNILMLNYLGLVFINKLPRKQNK